jgi:hypothetical protein
MAHGGSRRLRQREEAQETLALVGGWVRRRASTWSEDKMVVICLLPKMEFEAAARPHERTSATA